MSGPKEVNIGDRAPDPEKQKLFDDADPDFTGISKDVSKLSDEEVEADPTLWREKGKRYRRKKFDDVRKSIFLKDLLANGKMVLACKACGISKDTVVVHRREDEQFNLDVEDALAEHAKDIIKRIEKRAMEGYDNPVFDKEGAECGIKTTFETPLAVKMLARYDPDYRDKTALDLTTGGGAAIVAPPTLSMEEFVKVAAIARTKMLEDQAKREADEE